MAKMSNFNVTAGHLEDDELKYEIEYRGFEFSGDRSKNVATLRSLLALEKLGQQIDYPPKSIEFEVEIDVCKTKIKELGEKIDEFTVTTDRKIFLKLNSRLSHLMGRANRLAMAKDEEKKGRSSVITNILYIAEKLNAKLKLGKTIGLKHNDSVSFLMAASDSDNDDVIDNKIGNAPGTSSNLLSSTPQRNNLEHTHVESFTTIKSVPPYKWGIKFSGDDKEMSVSAFIEAIEDLKISRGISETDLIKSGSDLFEGRALCWFKNKRFSVDNWGSLKRELRLQFQPADYDYRLMEEIRKRTQGKNESMGIYLAVINNLFGRLSTDVSEKEKLQLILRNIAPVYQQRLSLITIKSQNELLEYSRKIESTEFACKSYESPPSRKNSVLEPDLAYIDSEGSNSDYNSTLGGKSFKRSNGNRSKSKNNRVVKATNIVQDRKEGEVSKNSEELVSEIRCYNCDKTGHLAKGCIQPRVLHCYKCGKKGVITRDCCKSGNAKAER